MALAALVTIDLSLFNINNQLYHAYRCKTTYKYIDKNGNSGTSKSCYEENNEIVCRDVKNVFKVEKIEKNEVCD